MPEPKAEETNLLGFVRLEPDVGRGNSLWAFGTGFAFLAEFSRAALRPLAAA